MHRAYIQTNDKFAGPIFGGAGWEILYMGQGTYIREKRHFFSFFQKKKKLTIKSPEYGRLTIKLTIKTPRCHSGLFIVNFEHTLHFLTVITLLPWIS